MEPVLSFVIPVRHPNNSLNHTVACRNLTATLASVAAQTDGRWNGVIVANRGTDLPPLPRGMKVVHVDLAPSTMNQWDYSNPHVSLVEFLTDKGRRVLAGLVALRPPGHVMVLDDDDLVSNRLVAFVARSPRANGWYFEDGWLWSEGDPFMYWRDEFYRYCGSSHIVRADLFQIPPTIAEARSEYIQLLGSHQRIRPAMEARGGRLEALPFHGAIYKIGHAAAHSRSERTLKRMFPKSVLRRHPRETFRRLLRLRLVTTSVRREFFGRA
ncbi:MAG: galactosyl transferase [Xanthobacteraceae bacterium]|nr:galactosyl transferase [Xanthobacteraceae bacterium]